jgi:lysyl-tRNA synthetase class 2
MKRLRERTHICSDVRRFFESRGFLEVETPVLVPSPGLEVHLDAFEVAGGDRGAPRWLVTSPEYQMKRLLADGWGRIFQIARCFRRGEVGALHNPEFSMVEWYRANASIGDVMSDTEQLVAAVTGSEVHLGPRTVLLRPPFERLSVCEAFERFAGWPPNRTLAAAASDDASYFRTLVDRVEPALAAFDHAVFLVDYPAAQASLARTKPEDARFAERFELYVAGVELCNGFGELVDPAEQRARMIRDQGERAKRNLPVYPVDERFLDDLSRVPPSAGNALGLDRLVALAAGATTIGEVLAFTTDEV